MEDQRIAIVDIADDLQVRKQRIFKILRRLSIVPNQRRDPARGNQNVATVTFEEAASIRASILATDRGSNSRFVGTVGATYSEDVGFFYLVQLEPEHDPGRFKVGFTTDLDGRLQKHRCSAPFATYLKSWPCRRAWERAAIDCISAGSEQVHTEVYRASSLDDLVCRAMKFFALMPGLDSDIEDQLIVRDGSEEWSARKAS